MAVYLIRAGESGPVKIGFAENVARRLTKMQSDNHEKLVIVRTFEGDENDELRLQVRFSHLRVRAEWFAWTDEFLGDLGLTEIFPDKKFSAETCVAVRKYLKENGLTGQQLAEMIGVHHVTFSKWLNGTMQPTRRNFAAISVATKGKVTPNDFLAQAAE